MATRGRWVLVGSVVLVALGFAAWLMVRRPCGPLGCAYEAHFQRVTKEAVGVQPNWDSLVYVYAFPGNPNDVRDELRRRFGPRLGFTWADQGAFSKDGLMNIHVEDVVVHLTDSHGKPVAMETLSPGLQGVSRKHGHALVWVSVREEKLTWFARLKRAVGL